MFLRDTTCDVCLCLTGFLPDQQDVGLKVVQDLLTVIRVQLVEHGCKAG